MGTLRSGVELYDGFTAPLNNIINALNLTVSAFADMQKISGNEIDTSSIEGARESINQATMAVQALEAEMEALGSQPTTVPTPEIPKTPTWQSDNFETFTSTGAERYTQEIANANNMLNALNETQQKINEQAATIDILPANAASDLNAMQNRIQAIQQRIAQIEANPLNVGSERANAGLESLRMQLAQALNEQENLNRAVDNMDVDAANQAYIQLSRTVGNTERYIRDNTDEQGRFNDAIEQGKDSANGLMSTIAKAVAAYTTIQSVKMVLNVSDTLTSTNARLNLMNDGLQTTDELQQMIFQSAERARGSYQATADAVSKLGLMAGDAFSSSTEIIDFTEQLNKQFAIAGTEAAGIDAAMLQLTQAMGSGILRGEEYNSVLEQAPNIIQAIADYMEVPKGQLKDMAAEGQITADIVKNALFAAADETNAQFESMPKTFEQIGQSIENNALMAFKPVLQELNNLANSEAFTNFVNNAIDAIATVATITLSIFEAIMNIGSAIADNWSIIEPIIMGIVTALGLYYGYLLITKAIETISAGVKIALAVASYAHAAATGAEASATAAATAAQYGLNTALLACPLTWILIIIITVIAAIYAIVAAINKVQGTSISATGVIVGSIYWVWGLIKNIGLFIANVALGIWNALSACCSNIGTAFHNVIASVQGWFYNLLSTALTVVAGICEALNKLPFVEFDYSGITSKANEYAAKSAEAYNSRQEYKSIGDAFSEGFNTYDAFADGWGSQAYNAGYAVGEGIEDKVSNFSLSDVFGSSALDGMIDYEPTYGGGVGGIADGVDDIAGNTGSIADSLDVTQEELKYLRDIAEQEAINRYTTAEITIQQTNNNTVSNNTDLDGVVDGLVNGVNEAIDIITEGVHK